MKYYWLKLKDDFFDREEIRIIEAQPNGSTYVLLYVKLLLKSLKTDGALRMYNSLIPYDENMLATITNTNVDMVRAALTAFKNLGMLQVLDDKSIFMSEVKLMIGAESESAERVRKFRKKKAQSLLNEPKTLHCNSGNENCNTEIEKELELEIDLEKELDINPPKEGVLGDTKKARITFPTTNPFFNTFWNAYPKKKGLSKAYKSFLTLPIDNDKLNDILEAIEMSKSSEQWQKENGRFIPEPSNWLQDERWNDVYDASFQRVDISPELDEALDRIYQNMR